MIAVRRIFFICLANRLNSAKLTWLAGRCGLILAANSDSAADLALLLSVLSSLRNQPWPSDTIVFGEIGLAGEIRPVQCGQERLREAAKHGFKRAIIPKANAPKKNSFADLEIHAVERLSDALGIFS